jgi:hypothetical protein
MLSNNMFDGTIPCGLGLLPNLNFVELSNNRFTGTLCSPIGSYLAIVGCQQFLISGPKNQVCVLRDSNAIILKCVITLCNDIPTYSIVPRSESTSSETKIIAGKIVLSTYGTEVSSSTSTFSSISENILTATTINAMRYTTFSSILPVSVESVYSSITEKNVNETTDNLDKNGSITAKHNPHPNLIPQASIYFARVKTTTGIAVTVLIGLAYGESYWLMILLISENRKFQSSMYQIALAATFFHVLNLLFYTVVMDYQLSPYLMGDQGIGAWALLCGAMSNIINILIYGFIILRLYTFMKVIIKCDISYRGAF